MAGIYIHIPFCKTRCIYCDFYTQTDKSFHTHYIETICEEANLRKDFSGQEPVETIYFGGGTPSQLSVNDLSSILDAIYTNFEVTDSPEITLEANPDDLNRTYIQSLTSLPINRLSIGIQSFNDEELQFLSRRHSAQKAKDAVLLCQNLGYNNISVDLMYGLPGQTLKIWEDNIDQALNLDIQHISAYHLIYEEDTELYRLLQSGKINPVNEDLSVEMFSLMIDKLAVSGFEQYEISNFAKDGLYSKHNSSYWLGKKYLGLGASAHSYDGENRMWNISSITKYTDGITEGEPVFDIEYLNQNTRYNDFILTGLRTKWGVNLNNLEKLFGTELKDYCLDNMKKYIDQEQAMIIDNTLKLTRKGVFISDSIMSDLMWVD
ncbi:MAG: radical SAM family heme chaperone HemW [Prevotella sp.]|jgi:oxygen-independent coproporphyrinogen-3 oxidase|nr:radical SAM family heme chaperone HemW [Prevotella sp.]